MLDRKELGGRGGCGIPQSSKLLETLAAEYQRAGKMGKEKGAATQMAAPLQKLYQSPLRE